MKTPKLFDRLHARLGDFWWYSLMLFCACRAGDAIQAYIGLCLVPKYVGQDELGAVMPLQQLSGLFAVPLAILATVFAKYVNTYATRGEYGKVKSFIRDVLLVACVAFLFCIATAYVVIPHFYERLNVQEGLLTVLILASGFATNISSLFTSALQGLKKFKAITVQSLIGTPIRLVTLMVAMPVRALSGYILGQTTPPAACSILAACSLHRDLRTTTVDTAWRKDIPEIWRYLWPVAIYMGVCAILSSVNATIYRQRLPDIESSAYYMLTRFAETAGYIGSSIMMVLVPLASEAHEKGKNNLRILAQTVIASIGCASALALIFVVAAKPLFAAVETWKAYAPYSFLLAPQTLATGIIIASGMIVAYEMACRRFRIAAVALILNFLWNAFLVTFTGADFFHGILPESLIYTMKSLEVATLPHMTGLTLGFAVLQLAVVAGLAFLKK